MNLNFKNIFKALLGLSVILLMTNLSVGCDQLNRSEIPKITATCVWSVYSHNVETFIINLEESNVLWIEEEQTFPILEVTDGYIKFSGIKSEMLGNGGEGKKTVNVLFKINRVSGRFDATSSQVKTDRVGQCSFEVAKF